MENELKQNLENLIDELRDFTKSGKRNSTTDANRIQSIHDLTAEMGACSSAKAGARFSSSDMKMVKGVHDAAVNLGADCTDAMKSAMKKETDGEHPAGHYLVVENPDEVSTWHLRIKNADGELDHRLMGAAWAALHGGYRGNQYKGSGRDSALAKLKRFYKREGLDTPAAKSISLDDQIQEVRSDFYEQFNSSNSITQPSGWIQEVFDDHVVAQFGEEFFQINYTVDSEGETIFDDKDKWVAVEKEYVPVKMGSEDMLINHGSEVKATQDGHLTGYLVTFGLKGDDSAMKDYFTKETDFGFSGSIKTPVFFHHTIPIKAKGKDKIIQIKDRVGEGTLSVDEKGVLIDAILTNSAYKSVLESNIKSMGWSSGTAGHLVEREAKSDGRHHVKRWLLGLDASLTPDPADKKNRAAISNIKTVQEMEIDNFTTDETKSDSSQITEGVIDMTKEEIDALIAQGIKTAREQDAAAAAAVKAAEDKQKADDEALQSKIQEGIKTAMAAKGKPVNKGGTKSANLNLKTELGDDAHLAFNYWMKTGDAGGIRTGEAYDEMKTTYSLLEGTQYQGQEVVPTEVAKEIFERRDPVSIVRAAGATVMQVGSNAIVLPIEKNNPEVGVITTIDASNTFDQLTQQPLDKASVTIYTFTKTLPIDINLLEDSVANVETWWSSRLARTMALTDNKYFVTGTGSGQPQGLVAGGTSAFTNAVGGTITAAEIVKLYHSLTSEYRDNVSWFMTGATQGTISGLSGNPFYFVGNGGMNGGVGNTGYPQGAGYLVAPSKVYNAADMATIAVNNKPVLVANVQAGYVITERKGLTVLRDPYTLATKGLINIIAYWRNSGAVVNAAAVQYLTCNSA